MTLLLYGFVDFILFGRPNEVDVDDSVLFETRHAGRGVPVCLHAFQVSNHPPRSRQVIHPESGGYIVKSRGSIGGSAGRVRFWFAREDGAQIQFFCSFFGGFLQGAEPAAGPCIFRSQDGEAYGNYDKCRAGQDKQGYPDQEHRHPDNENHDSPCMPQHFRIVASRSRRWKSNPGLGSGKSDV